MKGKYFFLFEVLVHSMYVVALAHSEIHPNIMQLT